MLTFEDRILLLKAAGLSPSAEQKQTVWYFSTLK